MTTLNHADKVNRQYNQTQSNFVTLQERLNESLALNPVFKNMLIGVVDEFKRRNKQWKKLSDIALCTSVDATLDQILIDTTMQRQLNFRHIVNILSTFKNTMVMPIQVYVDPDYPDKYIVRDGQHKSQLSLI